MDTFNISSRHSAWAQGSDAPEKTEVKVGFIPLTDCASVVMASVKEFDRKYGIRIVPSKEASWAAVRDKLVNGELDAAHVLYGLVYGVQLGLGGAWVLDPPNLLFFPVKDGEDHPSGEPTVVLDQVAFEARVRGEQLVEHLADGGAADVDGVAPAGEAPERSRDGNGHGHRHTSLRTSRDSGCMRGRSSSSTQLARSAPCPRSMRTIR